MNSLQKILSVITITALSILFFNTTSYSQNFAAVIDSAIRRDDTAVLKTHLTNENINVCNEYDSPLILAIRKGALNALDVLLENGADVNMLCKNYKAPLFYAVKYANLATVKKLVEKGARLDITFEGKSLLNYAKGYSRDDMVDYFQTLFRPKN